MDHFLDVNWLAVLLAALAGFVVGGIWYGPVMGKKWMAAVGLTEDDVKNANMAKTYGTTFLLSLVASFALAHILGFSDGHQSVLGNAFVGIGIAIAFVVTSLGTNYLFSQKSKTLFFIDAGYWMLFYIAMGTVHAYMP